MAGGSEPRHKLDSTNDRMSRHRSLSDLLQAVREARASAPSGPIPLTHTSTE
ncbi:hypothetical protein PC123_g28649 [Phytophthora cactorum]|nr:hypothetical protein PC120_g28363 [Phytophthora cactorum]KAG4035227.1 hypothetical protein PC123_g28649 [Phytophthora cactorum]